MKFIRIEKVLLEILDLYWIKKKVLIKRIIKNRLKHKKLLAKK